MAQVIYANPVEKIEGAISKGGPVFRQKKLKIDDKGHYVLGKKEIYTIQNPRDYKINPKTEKEEIHRNAFGQASRQTDLELNTPERREYWIERFNAQLNKPEKGNTKSYISLRSFVRVTILRDLKKQS